MRQSAFINNPELRRSAWHELSLGRLVAMPIILSAIFLLVYLIANESRYSSVPEELRNWSLVMFGFIVLVWGSKQAAESIVGEVNDKTWDSQRLTLISPWVMSIGKLFGSTMYNWYGGGLCLIVYVWNSLQLPDLDASLKAGLLMVLNGILLHSIVISMTLIGIKKNRNLGKVKSTFYFLLALVIGGYLSTMVAVILDSHSGDHVQWYLWDILFEDLAMPSVFVFTGWGVFGLYRNMRTELQHRNGPWVWYGFLLFLIFYCIGFVNPDLLSPSELDAITPIRYYIAYIITIGITYYMVFSESKYIVDYRQILHYLKLARYRELLYTIPLWLLTLLLVIPISMLGVGLSVLNPAFNFEGGVSVIFPLTMLCFVIRDICFLIYMNLAEKAKRADLATIIYLLLLYALAPSILGAAKLEEISLIFIPNPEGGIIGFVPVFLQVLLVGYLLVGRYKMRNKGIQQGTPSATPVNLPPA